MEKIPTAEEFMNMYHGSTNKHALIEFAKLHVESTLKAVSENHEINDYDEHYQYSPHLDKDSILNSYPPDKIK